MEPLRKRFRNGRKMSESMIQAGDFRRVCCEHFDCTPDEYSNVVFWQTLPKRAEVPARLINLIYPDFFRWDLILIQSLAAATSVKEMESEINAYRCEYRVSGFVRRRLRIRVSARKLLDLGKKVLPAKVSD